MDLLKNPLFNGISLTELSYMQSCFKMENKIYNEKDEIPINDKVGILLSGCLSINRLNEDGNFDMLEYLSEGDVFGTFFSFPVDRGDVIAICEKNCKVVLIDKEHITKRCSKACKHHTVVVENLLNLMTYKVQQLSDKVEILSHRTIREKLLCYFRMQRNKTKSDTLIIPFSFSDLANYLCIDRSAMTREIGKMKSDGLIEVNGRNVKLYH